MKFNKIQSIFILLCIFSLFTVIIGGRFFLVYFETKKDFFFKYLPEYDPINAYKFFYKGNEEFEASNIADKRDEQLKQIEAAIKSYIYSYSLLQREETLLNLEAAKKRKQQLEEAIEKNKTPEEKKSENTPKNSNEGENKESNTGEKEKGRKNEGKTNTDTTKNGQSTSNNSESDSNNNSSTGSKSKEDGKNSDKGEKNEESTDAKKESENQGEPGSETGNKKGGETGEKSGSGSTQSEQNPSSSNTQSPKDSTGNGEKENNAKTGPKGRTGFTNSGMLNQIGKGSSITGSEEKLTQEDRNAILDKKKELEKLQSEKNTYIRPDGKIEANSDLSQMLNQFFGKDIIQPPKNDDPEDY